MSTDTQDFRRIISDLDEEPIRDQTSIGRIVTALIAFFAVISFVFILWYAYTEGKRQGLANIQHNQGATAHAPTSSSQQNTPPTYSLPSPQQNNSNTLSTSQKTLSQNAFSQSNTSDRSIPLDPTQPIALSDPNHYKKTSSVPPPPSFTSENQNPANKTIPSQSLASSSSNEQIDTVVAVAAPSQKITRNTSTSTTDKKLRKNSTNTTPSSLASNSSQDYGYVIGGDFADQWRIQLASLRSEKGVNAFWNNKKDTFPGLLAGLKLQIEKIAISGKGDFFRVKAGPFLSRAEASRVCDDLKANKVDCLIVRPS